MKSLGVYSEVWTVAGEDIKVLTWENLEVYGNERWRGNLVGSCESEGDGWEGGLGCDGMIHGCLTPVLARGRKEARLVFSSLILLLQGLTGPHQRDQQKTPISVLVAVASLMG